MAFDPSDVREPFFSVLCGYVSNVPLRLIPDLASISFEEAHNFFLNRLLLNPHVQAYPPAERYQILFWKWAIETLESLLDEQDAEIDDRLYNHLVNLIRCSSSSGTNPPSASYVTYLWKSSETQRQRASICAGVANATLLESRTLVERGTTGLTTWTASISLAEFLFKHSELVQGKRVLELGCGAGFLGIVVATLQQRCGIARAKEHGRPSLWLTDVDSNVLSRCQDNIQLPCNASSCHPDVHCAKLNWMDANNPAARPSLESTICTVNADVIIGADIVFDPAIIPALVDTMSLIMHSGQSKSGKHIIAYIALTVRNEETLSRFVHTSEHSLELLDISTELVGQGILAVPRSEDQEIRLYRIQRRR
ncbi:putative methyltransferase-domain-containing protein [Rhodofomes roseus]|uniref:Methyltransferase-domain-containing protein n=1 Tax=Rhodofomes roseus TaxID=34475 RepID=A0ABQ8KIN7_9APHY|nr:putative methyltransferase-domain-containing protein [Rhodofomes roseus]KAH9837356.1 putative methyltransferase-domain-containing protein [Rhodofomes roseus]